MDETRIDVVRRRLVIAGLTAGPALAVASVGINLGLPTGSMRAQFDIMGEHAFSILLQDLLETIGFLLVLASLAAVGRSLRARGAAVGTWGSVLALLGIAGFAFSNASGLLVVALSQLPDRDAAFQIATTITSSGVSAVGGTFGFALEMVGQVGMLLVIVGLVRARMIKVWVLLLLVVGIVVNAAIGTMVATFIADMALLAVGIWIAVAITRTGRHAAAPAVQVRLARPLG